MKILCVSDVEDPALWDFYPPSRTQGVDLIISCGELNPAYLEFLVTVTNRPLLYVPGNHDQRYDLTPPEGCVNIDGRIVTIGGLRILGLGGSQRYKPGSHMYTEKEMRQRIRRLTFPVRRAGGIDLFVTHAPAQGFGDLEDLPHQGFACFNDFLERRHPAYMLHGHVHQNYGLFERRLTHPCGTEIINVSGRYLLEIPDR